MVVFLICNIPRLALNISEVLVYKGNISDVGDTTLQSPLRQCDNLRLQREPGLVLRHHQRQPPPPHPQQLRQLPHLLLHRGHLQEDLVEARMKIEIFEIKYSIFRSVSECTSVGRDPGTRAHFFSHEYKINF